MPHLISEIRAESRKAKFGTSLARSAVPDRGHGVLNVLAKSPATIPVPLISCSVDEALAALSREQPLLSRLLIPLFPSDNRLKRERQRRKSFPPSAAEGASSSSTATAGLPTDDELLRWARLDAFQLLVALNLIDSQKGDKLSDVTGVDLAMGVLLICAGTSHSTIQVLSKLGICAGETTLVKYFDAMIAEKKKKLLELPQLLEKQGIVILFSDNYVPKTDRKGSMRDDKGAIVQFFQTTSRMIKLAPWTPEMNALYGPLVPPGIKLGKSNLPFPRLRQFLDDNGFLSPARWSSIGPDFDDGDHGFDSTNWIKFAETPYARLGDFDPLESHPSNYGKYDDWVDMMKDTKDKYIGKNTLVFNVNDLAGSEKHAIFHNRASARKGKEGLLDNVANMVAVFHLPKNNIESIATSIYFIAIWGFLTGNCFKEKKALPVLKEVIAGMALNKRAAAAAAAAAADDNDEDQDLFGDFEEKASRETVGDPSDDSTFEELTPADANEMLTRLHFACDAKYNGDFTEVEEADFVELKKAIMVATELLLGPEEPAVMVATALLLRMQAATTTDREENEDDEGDGSEQDVMVLEQLAVPVAVGPVVDTRVYCQGMTGKEKAPYIQNYSRVLTCFLIVYETYRVRGRTALFDKCRAYLRKLGTLVDLSEAEVLTRMSSDADVGETFKYIYEFLEIDVTNSTRPFLAWDQGDMGEVMKVCPYMYWNAVFLGHPHIATNVADWLENYLRWEKECPNICKWMSLNCQHLNDFFIEHLNAMIRLGMTGNVTLEKVQKESMLVELKSKVRTGFRLAVGLKKRWSGKSELQRRCDDVKGEKYAKEKDKVYDSLQLLFDTMLDKTFKHEYLCRKKLVFGNTLKTRSNAKSGIEKTYGYEANLTEYATTCSNQSLTAGGDGINDILLPDLKAELTANNVPWPTKVLEGRSRVVRSQFEDAVREFRLKKELEEQRKAARETKRLREAAERAANDLRANHSMSTRGKKARADGDEKT